jgi:hypothetical protein
MTTTKTPGNPGIFVVTPEGLKSENVIHALTLNPNARALGRTFNLTIKRDFNPCLHRHTAM